MAESFKQLNAKQLDVALQSLQHALVIYKEIKDSPGQGQTLKNLGNVYFTKKDNAKAIEAYQQSLIIAREIKDRDLEEYQKTIEFAEASLSIARKSKSPSAVIKPLITLSTTYLDLGNYRKSNQLAQ